MFMKTILILIYKPPKPLQFDLIIYKCSNMPFLGTFYSFLTIFKPKWAESYHKNSSYGDQNFKTSKTPCKLS